MWAATKTNYQGGAVSTLNNIFQEYRARTHSSGNESRAVFSAFIGNKIGVVMLEDNLGMFKKK